MSKKGAFARPSILSFKHHALLVCGLAILSLRASAQSRLSSTRVINLIGYSVSLAPGAYGTIYKVPKDSCLVLTDVWLDVFYSTESLYKDDKAILVRLPVATWFHSISGLFFEPGSSVLVKNEGSYVDTSIQYQLHGYMYRKK